MILKNRYFINSILNEFLLIFSRAPIYCFAEDLVLNSANIILVGGNKVYASKNIYSLNINYRSRSYGILLKNEIIYFFSLNLNLIAFTSSLVKIHLFKF